MSRSLEKMMLIALGLMMVVTVGVPVLMIGLDITGKVSRMEEAHRFADTLQGLVRVVDTGQLARTTSQVNVPGGVGVTVSGSTLEVTYSPQDTGPVTWTETYNHTLEVTGLTGPGQYEVTVVADADTIAVLFELRAP